MINLSMILSFALLYVFIIIKVSNLIMSTYWNWSRDDMSPNIFPNHVFFGSSYTHHYVYCLIETGVPLLDPYLSYIESFFISVIYPFTTVVTNGLITYVEELIASYLNALCEHYHNKLVAIKPTTSTSTPPAEESSADQSSTSKDTVGEGKTDNQIETHSTSETDSKTEAITSKDEQGASQSEVNPDPKDNGSSDNKLKKNKPKKTTKWLTTVMKAIWAPGNGNDTVNAHLMAKNHIESGNKLTLEVYNEIIALTGFNPLERFIFETMMKALAEEGIYIGDLSLARYAKIDTNGLIVCQPRLKAIDGYTSTFICVYEVTAPNGETYVGSTKIGQTRFAKHIDQYDNGLSRIVDKDNAHLFHVKIWHLPFIVNDVSFLPHYEQMAILTKKPTLNILYSVGVLPQRNAEAFTNIMRINNGINIYMFKGDTLIYTFMSISQLVELINLYGNGAKCNRYKIEGSYFKDTDIHFSFTMPQECKTELLSLENMTAMFKELAGIELIYPVVPHYSATPYYAVNLSDNQVCSAPSRNQLADIVSAKSGFKIAPKSIGKYADTNKPYGGWHFYKGQPEK